MFRSLFGTTIAGESGSGEGGGGGGANAKPAIGTEKPRSGQDVNGTRRSAMPNKAPGGDDKGGFFRLEPAGSARGETSLGVLYRCISRDTQESSVFRMTFLRHHIEPIYIIYDGAQGLHTRTGNALCCNGVVAHCVCQDRFRETFLFPCVLPRDYAGEHCLVMQCCAEVDIEMNTRAVINLVRKYFVYDMMESLRIQKMRCKFILDTIR